MLPNLRECLAPICKIARLYSVLKQYAIRHTMILASVIVTFLLTQDAEMKTVLEKEIDIYRPRSNIKHLSDLLCGLVELLIGKCLTFNRHEFSALSVLTKLSANVTRGYLLGFTCHNKDLEIHSYKPVPTDLSRRGFVEDHTDKIYKNIQSSNTSMVFQAIGTICFPLSIQFLSKDDRKGYSVSVVENSAFHISMAFTDFALEQSSWCFSEFVNIQHPRNFNQSEYLFCGKKDPWTIVYTSHTVTVWIVGKRSARVGISYQVDEQIMQQFHLCQYMPSQHKKMGFCFDYSCFPYNDHLITHSIIMKNSAKSVISIVYMCLKKFQILKVYGRKKKTRCVLFDGPSIESRRLRLTYGRKPTLLSAFQATLLCHSKVFRNRNKNVFHFQPCASSATKKRYFPVGMFHFDKRAGRNTVAIQRIWIRQGGHFCLNISVESMQYVGSEDPLLPDRFGGVVVYSHGQRKSHRQHREELRVVFNISKNTYESHNSRPPRQHHVLTAVEANEVVIVYYYYALHCHVKATVSVSKSDCAGRTIAITPCITQPMPSTYTFQWGCVIFLFLYPDGTVPIHHVFGDPIMRRVAKELSRHTFAVPIRRKYPCLTLQIGNLGHGHRKRHIFANSKAYRKTSDCELEQDFRNFSVFDFSIVYSPRYSFRDIKIDIYHFPYAVDLDGHFVHFEDLSSSTIKISAASLSPTSGSSFYKQDNFNQHQRSCSRTAEQSRRQRTTSVPTLAFKNWNRSSHHRFHSVAPLNQDGDDDIFLQRDFTEDHQSHVDITIKFLTCNNAWQDEKTFTKSVMEIYCNQNRGTFKIPGTGINATKVLVDQMPKYKYLHDLAANRSQQSFLKRMSFSKDFFLLPTDKLSEHKDLFELSKKWSHQTGTYKDPKDNKLYYILQSQVVQFYLLYDLPVRRLYKEVTLHNTQNLFYTNQFDVFRYEPSDCFYGVYLQGNSTEATGTFQLNVTFHESLPAFSSGVVSDRMNLFFPSMTLPICFYMEIAGYGHPSLTPCFLQITTTSTKQDHHFDLPRLFHENINFNHTNLVPQCSHENCFQRFVSWNHAMNHCTSQNLSLPSVHSKKDMTHLKDQVDFWQWYSFEGLLYQSVGIYLGILFEVSFFMKHTHAIGVQ